MQIRGHCRNVFPGRVDLVSSHYIPPAVNISLFLYLWLCCLPLSAHLEERVLQLERRLSETEGDHRTEMDTLNKKLHNGVFVCCRIPLAVVCRHT